jgi:hypothetical protein
MAAGWAIPPTVRSRCGWPISPGSIVVAGKVPASVFIPRPRVESVLVRMERRPEPAVDPALVSYERLKRRRQGRLRPAAQDAAALAGRRGRSGGLRAGRRPPDARAEELDVAWRSGGGWPDEGCAGPGPGQAHGVAGGDRGAPRRLPRAAGRDGGLSLADELTFTEGGVRPDRRRPSRARGPSRAAGDGDNLMERALAATGRRAAVHRGQADPAGRRAGRRIGRRGRRAALGPLQRPRRGGPVGVRRAVQRGGRAGPGRGDGGEGHAAAVRGPGVPAPDPALRRGHGPGLRGLGRGSPAGEGPTRWPGRRWRSSPGWGPGATPWGTWAGSEPVLAGSGSTWFVEVVLPGRAAECRPGWHRGRDGPGWCAPTRCRRAGTGTEGGSGGRKLLAGPALPAGGLQHLLVLLLAHALAALLDQ